MIQSPTITQKSYSISRIKTLIDFNHDMVNFKVNFNIVSPENQTFSALIVNQETLDTQDAETLEYKTVQGSLSGEIVSDTNSKQSYFIILMSEIPMSVDVTLESYRYPDYIENRDAPTRKEQIDIKFYLLLGVVVLIVFYFIFTRFSDAPKVHKNTNRGGESLLAKLKRLPTE